MADAMQNEDTDRLSPLEHIFYAEAHNVCQKWQHYFSIYETHFARYRNKRLRFLEIGVSQGGSLDIWKRYFGSRASIVGVDIDPACRRFAGPQVEIIIGDQGDPAFLKSLAEQVGPVDAILDDGGHRMDQQILTLEHLYPLVKEGGVYMCEDVHTSYDPSHGGGLRESQTFIEYMKTQIDDLHSWYTGGPPAESIARTTRSIAFYDSIVVLEKKAFTGPVYVETGHIRPPVA